MFGFVTFVMIVNTVCMSIGYWAYARVRLREDMHYPLLKLPAALSGALMLLISSTWSGHIGLVNSFASIFVMIGIAYNHFMYSDWKQEVAELNEVSRKVQEWAQSN